MKIVACRHDESRSKPVASSLGWKANPGQALNEGAGYPPSVNLLATIRRLRGLNPREAGLQQAKADRSGTIPGFQACRTPEQAGGFEFRLGFYSGRSFAQDHFGHLASHTLHPHLAELFGLRHKRFC